MSAQDNLNGQQFYHGTSADLSPGDTIDPGHRGNFDWSDPRKVYFTGSSMYGMAVEFAKHSAKRNGGEPHVYEVEPGLSYSRDYDSSVSGNTYKSLYPLRILGEDHTWKTDDRWKEGPSPS